MATDTTPRHTRVDTPGGAAHCTVQGDGPWLVMSHSLACDSRMWDAQAERFAGRYTVLRYDTRGHGRSDAPAAPYRIEDLALDLGAILDAHAVAEAHLVGLSLGGLVMQAAVATQPRRALSLTLADTTAVYPEASKAMWADRIRIAGAQGMQPLIAPTLERWFTPRFHAEQPALLQAVAAMIAGTPVAGYAGCCAALAAADLRPLLGAIRCPTLVLVGEQDRGTPLALSEALQQAIAGARLQVIADAAHLSNVEQPGPFGDALDTFLASIDRR